jgi:argininosuccinate lyase
MKLWGGRFETGPSEIFERFSGSLAFDRRLLGADIRGSQAFARALEQAGILSAAERALIVEAFDQIQEEAAEPEFFDHATDEDVHTLVIRKLKEHAGAVADKIHTGRSRNEQVSLDLRLWLRGECDRVRALLAGLMQALLDLAARYPDAVIPGYTHTRRAQAVLWPHYLLAYFEMFARDAERFAEARRRVNVMPLGSGALAGSGFPFDREAMARDMGFDSLTANSMDVSADRDFALDFLYAASVVMLHLSRLAEDWILYSSEEFGWLELGDEVTSGSSLMPQKKNPDSLELIRGKSGRVLGCLHSLMVTMKGLPLTYNRDMQEDKEPLFDAVAQVDGSLEMARAVVEGARLNPARPLAAAQESWVVATDLAEALARAGTPFHQAHQLVGRLVLESVRTGRKPADWTPDE